MVGSHDRLNDRRCGHGVVTLHDTSGAGERRFQAFWELNEFDAIEVFLTRPRPWRRHLIEGEWPWGGDAEGGEVVAVYRGRCHPGWNRFTAERVDLEAALKSLDRAMNASSTPRPSLRRP